MTDEEVKEGTPVKDEAPAQDLEEQLAQEGDEAPAYQRTVQPTNFTADRVIKAEDIQLSTESFKWKVFLAGASGSGKTQVCVTLPGRKLLVDFDNRAETLMGVKNLDVYPCHEPEPKSPKAWNKAERLRQVIIAEVKRGVFPYDSLIFDGATMLGRMCLNWSLTLDSGRGLGGSPARQHYGPQMDNMAKYILSTLALPLNVVWTGHPELFEEESTGKHRFYPKITGKLRTELANWFNETYYTYRVPDDKGKTRYYWQTAGAGRSEFFKSSLNQLGKYWEDPILINFEEERVGFEDLFYRRFTLGKMK